MTAGLTAGSFSKSSEETVLSLQESRQRPAKGRIKRCLADIGKFRTAIKGRECMSRRVLSANAARSEVRNLFTAISSKVEIQGVPIATGQRRTDRQNFDRSPAYPR